MALAGLGDVIFGIANIETAEFGIEALATEAQQLSRGGAIILRQLQSSLNAKRLDDISRFSHQLFEWHTTHTTRDLLNGSG